MEGTLAECEVSVVVPVRNEAANIPELARRIDAVLGAGTAGRYELIFVTDINRDNTVEVIRACARSNARVSGIKLSNAFGHHVAVLAGLRACRGKAVVIMDGDLQDHPEDIPKLRARMLDGFDIVYGEKERKNESAIRNFFSRSFVRLLTRLSDYRLEFNTCMFRIVSRRVVDELLRFPERDPSLTMLMSLIGFPTAKVTVTSGVRQAGVTNFSYLRQINLAISFLVSFSTKPLRIISVIGFIVSAFSLLFFVEVLVERLVFHHGIQGWPTIVALISFLGGVQLLALGIIGEYIARIFMESKHRPLYIVEEIIEGRRGTDGR